MNTPARAQSRSTARLAAVQALYQQQMERTPLNKLIDEFHQHRLGREVDDEDHEGEVYADAEVDFFDDIVRGVDARRDEIDSVLTEKLTSGWTIARLDKTMVQILRAGTYELMARADVPTGTAISEYVDVAKAFFDDGDEPKFVNAVLDHMAREAKPEAF